MRKQLTSSKALLAAILALWLFIVFVRPAAADPAHFWISTSPTAPLSPGAPQIPGINGGARNLYIWAQPATLNAGAHNAGTNPFKTLQNFSLNLVTTQPIVDFLDSKIVVYNPTLTAMTRRFQFVHDSSVGGKSDRTLQQVLGGTPDRVRGIQGFSLSGASGFAGIGPTCHANDPFCGMTVAGSPAWLMASVEFQTVQPAGMADYFLQIGVNGMNHTGEPSSATSVMFGAAGETIYNAGTNRNVNLAGDNPDLMVQAFPPPPGDYNRNGIVDAADFTVWRDSQGLAALNHPADGTGAGGVPDGVVNSLDYDFWKSNFGTTVPGAGSVDLTTEVTAVPEPSAGWLLLSGACLVALRRALWRHPSRVGSVINRTHRGHG